MAGWEERTAGREEKRDEKEARIEINRLIGMNFDLDNSECIQNKPHQVVTRNDCVGENEIKVKGGQ